jgi:hypothetical protein
MLAVFGMKKLLIVSFYDFLKAILKRFKIVAPFFKAFYRNALVSPTQHQIIQYVFSSSRIYGF